MDEKKTINDIFEIVRATIADELKIDKEKINMESQIVNDLGAESLDVVLLLMELEDQFDSSIPQSDAEKFITISDVVHYIHDKCNNKA